MIDSKTMTSGYVFPKELVLKLLDSYLLIGKCDLIIEKIDSFYDKFLYSRIIIDTLEIIRLLKEENFLTNLSDQKIKLLLQKAPNNLSISQKMVIGIKDVLTKIDTVAKDHFLNSSDLLEYLSIIFNNRVRFNQAKLVDYHLSKNDVNSSIRHQFDKVLDNTYNLIKQKEFEKIMAILIAYLECITLKPYVIDTIKDYDVNKIAGYLLLIYLNRYYEISVFEMCSLLKLIKNKEREFNHLTLDATFNYRDNYFKLNDLTMFYLDLITLAFKENEKISSEHSDAKELSKLNSVERSIIFLPKTFTKEDIRHHNPYASDSTIMRALKEMSNDQLIMPLNKGRNAVWIKCGKEEDYLKYLR